jgi:hypothetical protein
MNLGTKLEHFKGWQSKVDKISKLSSPQGCIWHVDQVSQTPGWVSPGAGRPAQLLGWSARVWGGSAPALVATRLHEKEKPESVVKVGGGWSTRPDGHVARRPGHHMVPNRLIQVGGGPIHPYKYPPHGESRHTHTTFWRFHLQSSHS